MILRRLLSGRWIEANDWQGTFGVAHDIAGLTELMGGPEGLAGMLNEAFEEEKVAEDQGQMGGVSALMKLGLFSLRGTCSKEPVYEMSAPEFDEITIQLDPRYYSGREFKIKTHHNTSDNLYIQRAKLDGKPLENCWFYHRDFAKGGLLEPWLGPELSRKWGTAPRQREYP